MLRFKALQRLFEGRADEARNNGRNLVDARLTAVTEFHDMLGLETDPRSGVPCVPLDERGLPISKPHRIAAKEISIRYLAEAVMGHDFVENYYHPSGGFNFRNFTEAAVDPTSFVNINTFNLATAGLVNAQIMERFNQPEFFGRNLVTIRPSKMNGEKLIAVARMSSVSDAAKGRLPGEAHAEIGVTEAYQTTPETIERALKCRVTREAVFYDLTGQVLDEAGEVGHELAYGQEKNIADMVLGVTGLASRYNRNGTTYETYQTSSPWVNDASNPFADWNNLDSARQLFIGMTDPESGKEIAVNGTTVLVPPGKELLFRQQMFASQVQIGTQLNSNFPSNWTIGGNPINAAGTYTVTSMGAIWYNRMLAAAGLNLSASNALKYWYVGDYDKAFWWVENWPLTPWTASASELVMQDQGLIAVYGANYRGTPYCREPRYVVRSKN